MLIKGCGCAENPAEVRGQRFVKPTPQDGEFLCCSQEPLHRKKEGKWSGVIHRRGFVGLTQQEEWARRLGLVTRE